MNTSLELDTLKNRLRFMELEKKEMQRKIKDLESQINRLLEPQSSPMFSTLPKEMQIAIMSKMRTNDLLQWRAVSTEMKTIADTLLKHKRGTLVFTRNGGNQKEREEERNKTITLLKVFTFAKKIDLRSPRKHEVCMEFEDLTQLCKQYLTSVKELRVDDSSCKDYNCHLIADCFPQATSIELQWSLNEQKLSQLLESLPCVKNVCLSQVSGHCFRNIASNIEELELYIDNADRFTDFPRMDSVRKCKIWHYAPIDINESELVITTVVNQMRNVTHLNLSSLKIQNFDTLYFKSLEKLTLESTIVYSVTPEIKMPTVSSLVLTIDISSENMAKLLSKFPNVQNLQINSSYLRGFTLDVVNSCQKLCSLKRLNLRIDVRTLQDLVVDVPPVDGEPKNIVIELLKAVCFASTVAIDVYYRRRQSMTIIDDCKRFVANNEKKGHEIFLEFMRKP